MTSPKVWASSFFFCNRKLPFRYYPVNNPFKYEAYSSQKYKAGQKNIGLGHLWSS